MSQFFTSGGQTIGVSALASVLPMNTQDLFPLGWTGWISLQSKGLSRVFSNTTVQKHHFFSAQLSLTCCLGLSWFSFQRNPRADLLQNGLAGSPCSPRDSQESSPTPQFKSITSSALSLLLSPTFTAIHDHRKNHSLD